MDMILRRRADGGYVAYNTQSRSLEHFLIFLERVHPSQVDLVKIQRGLHSFHAVVTTLKTPLKMK